MYIHFFFHIEFYVFNIMSHTDGKKNVSAHWMLVREHVFVTYVRKARLKQYKDALAGRLFLLKQLYKHRIDTYERGYNVQHYAEHLREMEYVQKWVQNLQFLLQRKGVYNHQYIQDILQNITRALRKIMYGTGSSNVLYVFDVIFGTERLIRHMFKKDTQNWIYYLHQDFRVLYIQSRQCKKRPQIAFRTKSYINFTDRMTMLDLVVYSGKYEYALSGFLDSDPNMLCLDCFSPLYEKMTFLRVLYAKEYEQKIPAEYAENFFMNVSYRDIVLYTVPELMEQLCRYYSEFKLNSNKPIGLTMKKFMSANTETKHKILYAYLLEEYTADNASAAVLAPLLTVRKMYGEPPAPPSDTPTAAAPTPSSDTAQPQTNSGAVVRSMERELVSVHLFDLLETSDAMFGADERVSKTIQTVLPHRFQTFLRARAVGKRDTSAVDEHPNTYHQNVMQLPERARQKGLEKWKELSAGKDNSAKAQTYLDGLLRIPFGKYIEESIFRFTSKFIERLQDDNLFREFAYTDIAAYLNSPTARAEHVHVWRQFEAQQREYLGHVTRVLDASIHGHVHAKRHVQRIVSKWISAGRTDHAPVIGLQGPPGVGKTTLIKRGLARCLTDFINFDISAGTVARSESTACRPFAFIALGGSANGSTIEGHNYTYHGSTWGRIVDILMETKCMNPIIYIDELDKVSKTEHGREIIGILTHLTDPAQNEHFNDKYFSGVPLDLSRAIFVFSYNDASLIDPILRDRITEIKLSPIYTEEKLVIAREYLLPELLAQIGWRSGSVCVPDDVIAYVIEHYTYESGVRKLKECLSELLLELNVLVMENAYTLPYTLDVAYVQKVFDHRHRVRHKRVADAGAVGQINGMYASANGGGITIIQVKRVHHKTFLELVLTGQQGDVMKESMHVAKTVAWSLLTAEKQAEIKATWVDTGLHLHCPEGATPKDGPSAGAAITIAILSALIGVAVRRDVAITGEIELGGYVTEIGGLDMKLSGAKRAGVVRAYVPEHNTDALAKVVRSMPALVDDAFSVDTVDHIYDLLPLVFETDDWRACVRTR